MKRKTKLKQMRKLMAKARREAGQKPDIKDTHLASYLRGWNVADARFEKQRRGME